MHSSSANDSGAAGTSAEQEHGWVKAPLESWMLSHWAPLLFIGAKIHWLVQRQVVFVLLLALRQNSGCQNF